MAEKTLRIEHDQLRVAVEQALARLPKDLGHLHGPILTGIIAYPYDGGVRFEPLTHGPGGVAGPGGAGTGNRAGG